MINKLDMLIALAQEHHFGRAAERLGITQPTLSSGLRQLEEALGVRLVERGARFQGLTPEGQRALLRAQRISGELRLLRDEMRSATDGLTGQLRLSVVPTALVRAAQLTARVSALHPGLSFSVRPASSQEIQARLEAYEIEAGLTYLEETPTHRFRQRVLYSETYQFVCRADHPLAQQKQVSWKALAGLPLCLLTPEMQNRRIIDRNLSEAGIELSASLESSSNIVLAAAVVQGDWVTVLPTDMAQFLVKGHPLVTVPLHGGQSPSIGLLAPQQEPESPLLRALFQTAGKEVQPT